MLSSNESLRFVVAICFVTGARWSEAESLEFANCINQDFQFVPVSKYWFLFIQSRLEAGLFKPYRPAFKLSQL